MISIYGTIAIPFIACLCVSILLMVLYKAYWRNHKIAIFGAMCTATFVWVTYMHNLLPTMTIFVFVFVMLMAISICDALLTLKKKEEERRKCRREIIQRRGV